jgi:hypothetical protein
VKAATKGPPLECAMKGDGGWTSVAAPGPQVELGNATRKCQDRPLGRGAPKGAGGRRSLTAGFCLRLDPGDHPQAGPAA